MAKDLTIILEDRPGTLAEVGQVLGKAGINIEAFCGFAFEGKGVGHILVEDAPKAKRALEDAGIKAYAERNVLIVDAEDRPGMLGNLANKLADAGVNVDLVYKVTKTKIVFGVDDIEKAREVV